MPSGQYADSTQRIKVLESRVQFANRVVQNTLIQQGELTGAVTRHYLTTTDASIVPFLEEGATNTTAEEYNSYVAPFSINTDPTTNVLSPPTDLVATPGDGELTISFTPGNDGGSPITNYEYWVLDASGGGFEAFSPPTGAVSSVTITGLSNGYEFSIQLRAVNANGVSAASETVQGTPATTPSAPTGLSGSPANGKAIVSFTAGSDGGSSITKYQYSLDGTTYTDAAELSSPIVVTGLTNGTPVTIRLRAVNAIGNGTASSTVSVTPAIQRISFTTVGTTSWTAPAGITSVDYLIVGGGGGSGGGFDTGAGGGGGAGEVVTGTQSVAGGTSYTVEVGAGGIAGTVNRTIPSETQGGTGDTSSFAGLVAAGGIGGKGSRMLTNNGAGGSQVTAGNGGGGGNGGGSNGGGGGGGGNTSAGGSKSGATGGSAGSGVSSSISGSAVTYGQGGAGGTGSTTNAAIAGTANTGNGARGGGGSSGQQSQGAAGGSGSVRLAY